MKFVIQAGSPRFDSRRGVQVADVSDAIQTIFPMITEDAFLLWDSIPVGINYKYDFSILIDDLLALLPEVINSPEGNYRVGWGSNTFRAHWFLEWKGEDLTIESKWHGISGNYQQLLNSQPQLQIRRDQFVCEWKEVLRRVIDAIDSSGVDVRDKTNLESLRWVEAQIPNRGYLYAEP